MKAHLKNNKLIIDNEELFFKHIINSVGASIHIMKVNEDGKTLPIWMNEQYSRILGYSFEERQEIGLDYKEDELYHPDDMKIVHDGVKKLISGEADIYAGMFRAKGKDGNWKWLFCSTRSFSINGERKYLLSVVIDQSENMPQYHFTVNSYVKEISRLRNKLKVHELTKTEKQVIKELVKGKTTKQIAEECNRSYETINNHKRNIFKKLKVCKISELVSFAIENGLN